MSAHQPGFSTNPPPSADSTSSTSHAIHSPAMSDDRVTYTDDLLLHVDDEDDLDDDPDVRTETDSQIESEGSDKDSLADAPAEEVERVALAMLGFDSIGESNNQDKPDLWESHIFNRPPLGSENDKGEFRKLGLSFR